MAHDHLASLLIVNRDNAPDPLELCLPLDRALDESWCKQTAGSIFGLKKWSRFPATPETGPHIPEKAGIYMFVWKCKFNIPIEGKEDFNFRYVLYVGKAGGEDASGSLRKRYESGYSRAIGANPELIWKRDARSRDDLLNRFLNLKDLEFWFVEVGNIEYLEFHEMTLIKLFNPPANTQHFKSGASLKGKLKSAVPAF
jgi:hypothetical protein